MGYARPITIYRLVFDGEQFDGLEVRARSVSLGRILDLGGMIDALKAGDVKAFDQAREVFELFADSLKSWNLEQDESDPEPGKPIPATLDGLYAQDLDFAIVLVTAWIDAVSSVPDPLEPSSTNGSLPRMPDMPMESISLPV